MTPLPSRRNGHGRVARYLIVAVGAVAALVVGLLVALALLADSVIRKAVVDQASARTGREVTIEHLQIQPFSYAPRVRVSGVRIANADWANADRLADLEAGEVAISLPHLVIGRVVIPHLELERPRAFLERNAAGRGNWVFKDEPEVSAGTPVLPAVRSLRVTDAYGELVEGGRKSFVRLNVERRDDPGLSLAASGEGNWRGAPVKLKARAGAMDELVARGHPYPLQIEVASGRATLSYDGVMRPGDEAEPFAGRVCARGQDLSDLRDLAGMPLPHTKPYDLAAHLARRADGWHVDDLAGRVGTSDVRGTLALTTHGERPFLHARLDSKLLDLADLGGFVGATPNKPNPAAKSGRVVPGGGFDARGLQRFDADVTLKAGRLLQSDKLPLDQFEAHLVLDQGRLALDPLNFGVAKGKVSSRVGIDVRRQPMAATGDMRFEGLRLSELLPRSGGEAGGIGAVDGRAKLSSRGMSTGELLGHLDGEGGLVIRGGEMSNLLLEIAGLDGGEAVRFLVGGDRRVAIRCGVASFKTTKGVLRSEVFVLDTQDTKITGDAVVDLAQETMQISFYPQPKDPSIAVLRAPLHIKGPFAKPAVSVDKTAIATRAGAALLLGMVNPFLALVPLVETGGGEDADCSALVKDVSASKDLGRTPRQ